MSVMPCAKMLPVSAAPPAPVLPVLRMLLVAFAGAVVAVTIVVPIIGRDGDADGPAGVAVGIIVAAGLASIAGRRFVASRLDGTSDESLVTSYRTRFFLRLAMGEMPALVGFAVALAIGPWWTYFVALPFTALGFALAAPTPASIERDQAALRAEGCHRPLGRLLGMPGGPFA